jgi:hypothetical protein
MSKTRKGYSPALRRELVSRLYHQAKALRIPMTVLTDRLVEQGLNLMTPVSQFPAEADSTTTQTPESLAA